MPVKMRCPECRGAFAWDTAKTSPRYCPLCGYDRGEERADDDIAMPSIRSIRMATADKVYRDIERGSEVRAQAAAEMAGVPVSEMADLKITNLNSSKHPGDVAAPPVNNAVSQAMAMQPQRFGHQPVGAQYAAQVRGGPAPVERMQMQNMIRSTHEQNVARYVRPERRG